MYLYLSKLGPECVLVSGQAGADAAEWGAGEWGDR